MSGGALLGLVVTKSTERVWSLGLAIFCFVQFHAMSLPVMPMAAGEWVSWFLGFTSWTPRFLLKRLPLQPLGTAWQSHCTHPSGYSAASALWN